MHRGGRSKPLSQSIGFGPCPVQGGWIEEMDVAFEQGAFDLGQVRFHVGQLTFEQNVQAGL